MWLDGNYVQTSIERFFLAINGDKFYSEIV